VPVRVDHPRHDDPARGIDHEGVAGGGDVLADLDDPVVQGEDVRLGEHRPGVVHRQHGAAAQEHRP